MGTTGKLLASAAAVTWLVGAAPLQARAATGGGADAAANAEQQVAALMKQLQEARLNADAGFFERYMTGDYVGVHGDGATETKPQLVAAVRSGALRYQKYAMRELNVRSYGDAAVANTLVEVDAIEANGRHSAGSFRTTWAWVRRDGGWQCAAFQATRVVR